ncbi:MAG TPA: adenosylcobinamide-GDP ribazoletransferase [Stellaceae bacterium]|nr:adenosylcobinamide-GDP ribazoletransferase [Stellaceae bacterium]
MRPFFWSDAASRRDELVLVARFFTRLPLGTAAALPEPGALARAAWGFPVVGAGIGIVAAAAFAAVRALALPHLAAAFIAVGAGVLVTGALHEDGLADTADGCGGGDAEAKLAIMRDSRSGAFGVLALVFSVVLRAAALAAVDGRWAVLGALVAAHAVGRGALPAVLRLVPPARSDGLGAAAGEPDPAGVAWSLGIAAVLALVGLGLKAGIAALIAAAAVMALVAMLARRQIGGHTGDVLGAIEQGGEMTMLLAAASWAT